MGNYTKSTTVEIDNHVYKKGSVVVNASSDIEVIDGDKISALYVTTGSNDITITLTTTIDDRELNVKKIDNGSGSIIFVANIDGDTDKRIGFQNTSIRIKYDLNNNIWRVL